MSPRTGRPKANKPKCIDVKVRFDEDMNNALISYCNENSLTRTEAIRKAVSLLLSSK